MYDEDLPLAFFPSLVPSRFPSHIDERYSFPREIESRRCLL